MSRLVRFSYWAFGLFIAFGLPLYATFTPRWIARTVLVPSGEGAPSLSPSLLTLAASAGVPMSSHLYPEVSVHLLAATPTADWLEYVDWMNPLLTHPLEIRDGYAIPSSIPGAGLMWNDDAVQAYRATL